MAYSVALLALLTSASATSTRARAPCGLDPAPGFPTSIIGARALPSSHASFRRGLSVFGRVDRHVEY